MLERRLSLPRRPETFFLWGPRQCGKSTLLRQRYPDALWIDLLQAEAFRRYLQNPEALRGEVLARREPSFVVIDEIQKVPTLLDEVHWLHENAGARFALCGSSARKVRRGHANLLGGRALRFELFGLSASEIGPGLDLTRLLSHGYLPRIYLSDEPRALLSAYVADYLKEEVAAEALVRKLPTFSEFLNVAALSDTELVNFATIARDCGVSSPTIKSYFEVLEDTLLGRWLPAYRRRPKRRVIGAPKFYFADVGVVNALAKRRDVSPGTELRGKAFENWVFHELAAYNAYEQRDADLAYWRLASGIEVDFVVNDMELAVEAKASGRITSDALRGLRELAIDHPRVGGRIVVCEEQRRRVTEDGITIVPALEFVRDLWSGKLF